MVEALEEPYGRKLLIWWAAEVVPIWLDVVGGPLDLARRVEAPSQLVRSVDEGLFACGVEALAAEAF